MSRAPKRIIGWDRSRFASGVWYLDTRRPEVAADDQLAGGTWDGQYDSLTDERGFLVEWEFVPEENGPQRVVKFYKGMWDMHHRVHKGDHTREEIRNAVRGRLVQRRTWHLTPVITEAAP